MKMYIQLTVNDTYCVSPLSPLIGYLGNQSVGVVAGGLAMLNCFCLKEDARIFDEPCEHTPHWEK